jgi:undecaprenyl diphosphate synthase
MQHLAIIPDGNRRWAAKNKLDAFLGHKTGMESVRTAIKVCIKNSIKYLSFYTFSLENFRRSETEKNYLFNDLLSRQLTKELPELIQNGVRIKFIGDAGVFPTSIQDSIAHIEEQTKHLDTLQLNLLFCYGAQREVVHAVKLLAQKVSDGLLSINEITETTVSNALWTSGMPDPELIIRTGGVMRLSNFLLFQAAYSEFTFLTEYWPEVTETILEKCLQDFEAVQRNFGK